LSSFQYFIDYQLHNLKKTFFMKKLYVLVMLLLFNLTHLLAQWDGNPATVNNTIGTAPTEDDNVTMVTDGTGGAIAAWHGYNNNNTAHSIHIQRKTSDGGIAWQTVNNPILVDTNLTNYLEISDLESDGAGGAYITWIKYLNDSTSDIYLQHFNSNGTKLFGASGIKLNPSNGHNFYSAKLCVNTTGCIVCWTDEQDIYNKNTPLYAQVFVQQFNTAGVAQWTAGGVPASTVNSLRAFPDLINDGSNGVFISFVDSRNSALDTAGNFDNIDIYAQHINSGGSRLWGTTDAIVTTAINNQITITGNNYFHYMISDAAGGFILLYEDYRIDNNNPSSVYAQRINNAGSRLWTNEGVAVANASPFYKDNINLAYDGANGAVVSWRETDNGSFTGTVFAQRVSGAGTIKWGAGGKIISEAATAGLYASFMEADGAGNYIFNWTATDTINYFIGIKGQKIDAAGQKLWQTGGVDICANPDASPFNTFIIRSSGSNEMITAWADFRNGGFTGTDIYSAKIGANGVLIGTVNTNYISAANGNWSDAATWAGNTVPPVGADVIIRNTVIADVNATCNSLRVEIPGKITVNAGIAITLLK
jgi:hypothetical protein